MSATRDDLPDRRAVGEECFIDAMFFSAKGGAAEIGPRRRGKGMIIIGIVDRRWLPLAISTHAANDHEVTLVPLSYDFYMIETMPENLIGDNAYDRDKLDAELQKEGIEMIAPHRGNRSEHTRTQDGRRLRRYHRRWLVRPLFAWSRWQRRLLVPSESYPVNFLGFVQFAYIGILLKQF